MKDEKGTDEWRAFSSLSLFITHWLWQFPKGIVGDAQETFGRALWLGQETGHNKVFGFQCSWNIF